MRVFPTVCLVSIVVVAPLQTAQRTNVSSGAPQGSIGIVRTDGMFLPIAAYTGRRWRSLGASTNSPFRMNAEAKQLPRDGWTLRPSRGAERAFSLTGRTSIKFECSTAEGFGTTLAAGRPLQGSETRKLAGLAVLGNLRVEAATDLSRDGSEMGVRIRALISSTVQALETERFAAPPGPFPDAGLSTITPTARRERPITVTPLFHHRSGSRTRSTSTRSRTIPVPSASTLPMGGSVLSRATRGFMS
jgi:hypothetical protein